MTTTTMTNTTNGGGSSTDEGGYTADWESLARKNVMSSFSSSSRPMDELHIRTHHHQHHHHHHHHHRSQHHQQQQQQQQQHRHHVNSNAVVSDVTTSKHGHHPADATASASPSESDENNNCNANASVVVATTTANKRQKLVIDNNKNSSNNNNNNNNNAAVTQFAAHTAIHDLQAAGLPIPELRPDRPRTISFTTLDTSHVNLFFSHQFMTTTTNGGTASGSAANDGSGCLIQMVRAKAAAAKQKEQQQGASVHVVRSMSGGPSSTVISSSENSNSTDHNNQSNYNVFVADENNNNTKKRCISNVDMEDERIYRDLVSTTAAFYRSTTTTSSAGANTCSTSIIHQLPPRSRYAWLDTASNTSSVSDTESENDMNITTITGMPSSSSSSANNSLPQRIILAAPTPQGTSLATTATLPTTGVTRVQQPKRPLTTPKKLQNPSKHKSAATTTKIGQPKLPQQQQQVDAALKQQQQPAPGMTMGDALAFSRHGRLVVASTPPFRVIFANAAVAKMHGRPCHEISGQPLSRVLLLTKTTGRFKTSVGEERVVALRKYNNNKTNNNNKKHNTTSENCEEQLRNKSSSRRHCTDQMSCRMTISPILSTIHASSTSSPWPCANIASEPNACCVTHLCVDLVPEENDAFSEDMLQPQESHPTSGIQHNSVMG